MPWLTDYCNDARQTDRLAGRSDHVDLLATGLFGETGSVLAELKKAERETAAYPSYRNRLVEEIGDLLWYFARLVTVLAPSEVEKLEALAERAIRPGDADAMSEALALGAATGALLATLQQKTDNVAASQLGTIWLALLRVACAVHVDLSDAARRNLEKTESRWPPVREFVPLFDDDFEEEEQLPRALDVEFRQVDRGGKPVVLLRCNGLNLGDRLTDNIDEPDFYRFHDIFHLAHAVYLGWSPILRVLLNCKRKSDPVWMRTRTARGRGSSRRRYRRPSSPGEGDTFLRRHRPCRLRLAQDDQRVRARFRSGRCAALAVGRGHSQRLPRLPRPSGQRWWDGDRGSGQARSLLCGAERSPDGRTTGRAGGRAVGLIAGSRRRTTRRCADSIPTSAERTAWAGRRPP